MMYIFTHTRIWPCTHPHTRISKRTRKHTCIGRHACASKGYPSLSAISIITMGYLEGKLTEKEAGKEQKIREGDVLSCFLLRCFRRRGEPMQRTQTLEPKRAPKLQLRRARMPRRRSGLLSVCCSNDCDPDNDEGKHSSSAATPLPAATKGNLLMQHAIVSYCFARLRTPELYSQEANKVCPSPPRAGLLLLQLPFMREFKCNTPLRSSRKSNSLEDSRAVSTAQRFPNSLLQLKKTAQVDGCFGARERE